MSNKSLTLQGSTVEELSGDTADAVSDGSSRQEPPGLYLPGAGRLAHAMTADEDNRMQSKRIVTSASSSHDKQDSDTGLQAADLASGNGAESEETGVEDGPPVGEKALDRPSPDTRKVDDSIPQAVQEDTDTQEDQERRLNEEAGADGPDQGDIAPEDNVKHIVEAALLASGKPLSVDRLLTLFLDNEQPDRMEIRDVLEILQQEYEGRGIEVREVSTGWRIQVRKEYAPWVSRLWEEKPGRYSRALLETLSLIAYRQPITRGEIEDVRGVAVSTNIVKTLLERDWVRVVGHRDVPGRPSLYATTREFLDYFGLKSLDELPTLAELKELDDLNPSLDFPEPDTKTDLQDAHEEDTHDVREADAGRGDDAGTESQQQTASGSGEADEEEVPDSQDERIHQLP
jgi:segregation and condensation protein B